MTRYAIGVGARSAFEAEELAEFVREVAAKSRVDLRDASLAALGSHDAHDAFARTAQSLKLAFIAVPIESLQRRKAKVLTRSPRVEGLFGVGSLCEALALAAAGEGSRLLSPRSTTTRLSCAIARSRSQMERDLEEREAQ